MAEVSADGPIVFVDVTKDQREFTQYVAKDEERYPIEEVVVESLAEKQDETTVKNETPSDPDLKVELARIKCTLCNRTAVSEEKLLQHIRKVHRGENPFQCYMCEYSTYNKSLFEEHVRIHQGIKPFKCSHCPYRSASKKNTKKHELVHRPNNPLKCPDCTFIARNTKVLNCHKQKTHTKNDAVTHKCPKCDITFGDFTAFNNHRKSKKRCKICAQLFCQNILKKHELDAHGVVKKKRIVQNRKKLFACNICKWSSSSKPRILLHLIHHPDQDLDSCEVDVTVLRQCGILPAA